MPLAPVQRSLVAIYLIVDDAWRIANSVFAAACTVPLTSDLIDAAPPHVIAHGVELLFSRKLGVAGVAQLAV